MKGNVEIFSLTTLHFKFSLTTLLSTTFVNDDISPGASYSIRVMKAAKKFNKEQEQVSFTFVDICKKKYFFGGKFYFFKKKKLFFGRFFYFLRPAFSHGHLGHPQSLEYFFLFGKKNIFLGKKLIFERFYGQRSVTAAWATRSPWSIFLRLLLLTHFGETPIYGQFA